MGKCIICGCETDDFRCLVRKEKGKKYDDFQCEECTTKKVSKLQTVHRKKFKKRVLPILIKNNFKVVVRHCTSSNETTEEFRVAGYDIMQCVSTIRDRMEKRGFIEDWIDVHWEQYKGIQFEVVDYLSYTKRFNEHDNSDETETYFLELIGDNKIKFKYTY